MLKFGQRCSDVRNFFYTGLWPTAYGLRRARRGQTAVEYLLVTVSLTVAFAMVYRVLQVYLSRQFENGGVIILRMYSEDPM